MKDWMINLWLWGTAITVITLILIVLIILFFCAKNTIMI